MRSNLLPVAKESLKYLYSFSIAFIIFMVLDFEILALGAFIGLIYIAYSFRNPERQLPLFEMNSVLSSSDGIVTSITELIDDEYAYKIEIESNCTDVGLLRAPLNAKVVRIDLYNGTRVSKKSKLFNDTNENVTLVFEDEKNHKVKIVHRLKKSFAPLYIDVRESKNIHQTSRYGLMVNGTTSIYLPSDFRLNVTVRNELKASETLLGYFS